MVPQLVERSPGVQCLGGFESHPGQLLEKESCPGCRCVLGFALALRPGCGQTRI